VRMGDAHLMAGYERERSSCHPMPLRGRDLAQFRAGAAATVAPPVGGAARDARAPRRVREPPKRRTRRLILGLLDGRRVSLRFDVHVRTPFDLRLRAGTAMRARSHNCRRCEARRLVSARPRREAEPSRLPPQ
jgi:hypothetical protein